MRPQVQLVPDLSALSTADRVNPPIAENDPSSSLEISHSENKKGIGLALSGGGFRATLFHLGVVAFLRDANKLGDVSHITSVSGGSILAAHLVLNWEAYTGSQEDFESAASEIVTFVRKDVRGRVYRRAPMHLPFRFLPEPAAVVPRRGKLLRVRSLRKTTTDILIDHYSELYRDETLEHLECETPRPQLYLLTTNQTDGTLCSFCRNGFQDEDLGLEFEADTISIARAVAASSAFPGLFPPVSLTPRNSGIPQRDLRHPEILLTDGGVYDNLGLRKFKYLISRDSVDLDYIVVSDASAEFKVGYRGGILEPLRTSMRAADILSKRINELERDVTSDDMFKLVYIGKIIKKSIDPSAMGPVLQRELVSIRTDLDKFTQLEISALVRHGYCVARARLENDKKNGTGDQFFTWWDPLPQSKHSDVVALREASRRDSEHLRQRLDAGSRRKLRLASHRDPATYFQLFVVLAVVLAYYFLPSAYSTFIDANIAAQTSSIRNSYRAELLERKVTDGVRSGFAEGSVSSTNAKAPIETWNTSQATYALLKSGNLDRSDRDFLIASIKSRFVEAPRGDFLPKEDGWYARPSLQHLQAEPALWTGAAIALLLQEKDLDPGTRAELQGLLDRVRVYLVHHRFYDPPTTAGPVAFNVFGNQQDTNLRSAYSTSLALLMLIEVRRAGVGWGGEDPTELINRILAWFNREYDDQQDASGWRSIDFDLNNALSEAVTLQCLAIMLEAYQEIDQEIPYRMHLRIRDHLLPLEASDGVDSAANARITLTDPDGIERQAEPQITFLWRPWALRLCRLWVKHASEHTGKSGRPIADEEKAEFRNLLYRLVVDRGSKQFELDAEKLTFVSSEMLLAYAPIP